MARRFCRVVAFWVAFAGTVSAHTELPLTASIELLLPPGATATADGRAIENPLALTIAEFKKDEIRRLKIAVKFPDGSADERLVDVSAGQRLRLAIPQPGPERALVIGALPLVPINAAAVSADGRHIAFGLDARTVVLWDTAVGRPVRTLVGHQKPVLAVAFSPDGKTLLTGSADTTAVLWDVETGQVIRTYKGHTGSVVSVAFSPDGKRILTGSPEGLAIHWETGTGEPVHKLKGRSILSVAWSPDGKTLATSSSDGTATLWDAATGKQTFLLRGHREDVNCVTFSPDGRRAVTGSSDDTGAVWDVATGTRITRTARHTVNIHSAAFTPDGRRVITGEREELIIMSDAATGTPVRTFVGHGAEILSIVPNRDGTTMLTASRDGTARIWDLTSGRELLTLTTDGTGKSWAAVSSEGYFDGSEAGRKALGYRFPKGSLGDVDTFFADGFRPGLLAAVWRGERPLVAQPLGRSTPPLVKLTPPKGRVPTDPTATLTADITDRGGGVGTVVIENNGIRLTIPATIEAGTGANPTRVTVTVPLTPGANRVGIRAATRDGTRESAAAEIELSRPIVPGHRGRLYVVAIGVGPAAKDARALAEFLRDRGRKLFDRVDIVPVFDREATRTNIEDTVKDVAELSRPQDTIVVAMCGNGGFAGERAYFVPHDLRDGKDPIDGALQNRGIALDDIATALGSAKALNRSLIIDVASINGDTKARSEFGLRGAVERWGRMNGLHVLASVATPKPVSEPSPRGRTVLIPILQNVAGGLAWDVTDWFHAAAEKVTGPKSNVPDSRIEVYVSSRVKGFPVLTAVP